MGRQSLSRQPLARKVNNVGVSLLSSHHFCSDFWVLLYEEENGWSRAKPVRIQLARHGLTRPFYRLYGDIHGVHSLH